MAAPAARKIASSTSLIEVGLTNWLQHDAPRPHTSPANRSTSVDKLRRTAGRGSRQSKLSTPIKSARDFSGLGSLLTHRSYCCSPSSCSTRRCASSREEPVIVTLLPSGRSTVMVGSCGRVARHDAMDTPSDAALIPLLSTSDIRSRTAPCCPETGGDDDPISTLAWRRTMRSKSSHACKERISSSAASPAIRNITCISPPPQHAASQPVSIWRAPWLFTGVGRADALLFRGQRHTGSVCVARRARVARPCTELVARCQAAVDVHERR